jgi:NurA domain
MIDPTIRQKAEQAAYTAAERAQGIDLDDWLQRLYAAGKSPLLQQRLELAKVHRWAGAIPTWEPVDLVRSSNAEPVDVIGIDGSQIFPQDRSPVLWTYIQAVAYRKLVPPIFESKFVDICSELTRDSLLSGELVENLDGLTALTNTWRVLLEMRLARIASVRYPGQLILLDNGLLPWLSVSGLSAQRHFHEYLNDLIAICPSLIAGVISGPQSRLLSRLIALIEAETVERGVDDKPGLLDILLIRYALEPGERSALFLHASPRNDVFLSAGGGVYFFFLRVNRQEVVRIEIPEWVANNPNLVDVVQASILADVCMTGYSYVLSQAHLHAVIPTDVAQLVQARTLACYWQAVGQITPQSAKIRMKRA